MIVLTDNGIDLAPEILDELDVEIVPLDIELDGKRYRGGIDIDSDAFYKLVRASDGFPTTSQPAPGDFETTYIKWIEHDPDMISVHMSKEISGTWNSARLGAEAAAKLGANVTVIDSGTASGALGWQVEVAARAAKAGWSSERVKDLVAHVGPQIGIVFSPDQLKYLVHGGRVSHIQGFAASMLNIKPILSIRPPGGKIESIGRVRTLRKAINEQINIIEKEVGAGAKMRFQVEHADNPESAAYAQEQLSQRFDAEFRPTTSITPVIGAHTGPGVIAIVYAPQSTFDDVP